MKKLLFIIPLLSLLIYSCKNDDDGPATIYDTWEVVSATSPYFVVGDHVQFIADQTIIYSVDDGYRKIEEYGLQNVTSSSFDIVYLGSASSDYIIEGTDLKLSGDIIAVLRRSSFDTNNFVKEVVPSGGFQLPAGVKASDPGFSPTENAYYYADGYGNNKLYLLDMSGGIISSANISQSALTAVPYVGGAVVSSNGSEKIYLVNKDTGALLDQSPDMGPWIKGIAVNGDLFYCLINNGQKIFTFNGATLGVTDVANISFGPTGAHYHAGFLYLTSYNMIYKVNPSTYSVMEHYRVDTATAGGGVAGITHNGSSFIVAIDDNTNVFLKPVVLN